MFTPVCDFVQGGGYCLGGLCPGGGSLSGRPPEYGNVRAVRILLGCILVDNNFIFHFRFIIHRLQ